MKRVLNWVEAILVSPVLLYRYLRFKKICRRIYLGEGQWTILSQADYRRLKGIRWYLFANHGKFYAHRNKILANGCTKIIAMHREIMNAPKGKLVDHRNGHSLDNRRSNLRFATQRQNLQNKRKTKSKTTSKFRGVFRCRKNKWASLIKYRGKRFWLGTFDNEIDAARAYDKAAKKYFGEYARLNLIEPQVPSVFGWFAMVLGRLKKIVNNLSAAESAHLKTRSRHGRTNLIS